ncbi:hypothetical protein D9611_012069 [Ephemerocybe angulata]|uniref:Uncharacterized protein n=1 Tax=Ephemerocybe angulata TaxID=980116 RepID=A0A8H5ASZ8_9AGAR|nr:hypothetical protein D9611_012069 [Tulosesus angulatus]
MPKRKADTPSNLKAPKVPRLSANEPFYQNSPEVLAKQGPAVRGSPCPTKFHEHPQRPPSAPPMPAYIPGFPTIPSADSTNMAGLMKPDLAPEAGCLLTNRSFSAPGPESSSTAVETPWNSTGLSIAICV